MTDFTRGEWARAIAGALIAVPLIWAALVVAIVAGQP